MAYRHHATGQMRRPLALAGIAFALSFIVVGAMAGQHSHTDTAESPAACAVCVSTQQAPVVTAPAQIPDLKLEDRRTPPEFDSRLAFQPSIATTDRARAPPASLAL
ncbi:hypothetical protein [Candidatus Palauibacter sp.]|uniref:hypothetical protein n=1 Tax=Candidatus Palauibacter sp. TaxID=3101350 RepID=UPI003AF25862